MATLIRSETTPPDLTLYVKIALGASPSDMTGIFFSRNFNSEMPLDIILYLRGWTANALPIDQFWSNRSQLQRLLREKVNRSGKDLVFVAPTLGAHSEAGKLIKSGYIDEYLDQVIDSFKFEKRRTVTIRSGDMDIEFDDLGVVPNDNADDDDSTPGEGQDFVDNLILAAHSGGGTRLAQVAKNLNRYKDKVAEVWGFDCTYVSSDAQDMVNWARAHSDAKLYYHFIPGSPTQSVALDLKARASRSSLKNITVLPTDKGVVHDWVPITYLETRIRKSSL